MVTAGWVQALAGQLGHQELGRKHRFAELAGRGVVGIHLLTCVPGWWTMLSQAVPTLWLLEWDSFLSWVALGTTGQAARNKWWLVVGRNSVTLTGAYGTSVGALMGEASGTVPNLQYPQGAHVGAQTSDLWNRKPPESLSCRGRWRQTAAGEGGTGWGGLASTRVKLPVAFQAGQTPDKVAPLSCSSGWWCSVS